MNKAEHLGHSSHQLPASGSHGELLVAGATNSEAQLLELATHLHNDPSVGRDGIAIESDLGEQTQVTEFALLTHWSKVPVSFKQTLHQ